MHRHKLPPTASSISARVGRPALERKRAYMDMTKPGVQKPHCEPCASAIALCTGWRPERRVPRPSTVTTCVPSHAYSGKRQALTARWCTFPASCEETITVHAPQPPSPQPSFVPERPRPGKGGRRRGVGGDAIRMVLLAFGSRCDPSRISEGRPGRSGRRASHLAGTSAGSRPPGREEARVASR